MALPEPSPKEGQKSKSIDQDDKDFDPTPEALIDEIDDERTLEEEEALDGNNGTAVQEELDDLKKESEMPIEELLAYYERMRSEAQDQNSDEEADGDEDDEEVEEDEEEEDDNVGDELHERKKRKDDLGDGDKDGGGSGGKLDSGAFADSTSQQQPSKSSGGDTKQSHESSDKPNSQNSSGHRHRYLPSCGIMDSDTHSTTSASLGVEQVSGLVSNSVDDKQRQFTDNQLGGSQLAADATNPDITAREKHRHSLTDFIIDDDGAGGMFKTLLGDDLDDSDDMDDDYSYTDDENGDDERDWRRVIHVGPDYQADVPEGLIEYGDLPPYENEDKLIWRCNSQEAEERIPDYLKQASSLCKRNDICISSASVPKISEDSLRQYRDRMNDITSSTGSHPIEIDYHQSMSTENSSEALADVYMSQSRKRVRIDYELEQENAMDGTHQVTCGSTQNQLASLREDNSDSISQDTKPELAPEEYFQDEEQLLFLLLQCNYNFDEALRRRKIDPFKYYLYEPMTLWSEEECLGFEHGLRVHGKDFRSIRENKVQTRTHAEVVAFYYLWKKSERHDVYTNQYKLGRKRCLSHPGTTDYMDEFIEDNESNLNASSSATPTLTDSTLGMNSTADIVNDNNSSSLNYHSLDPRSLPIQCNDISQGSANTNIHINHIQLNQSKRSDEDGQSNSVCIDSNTAL